MEAVNQELQRAHVSDARRHKTGKTAALGAVEEFAPLRQHSPNRF
jgi:hypothetical protein